MGAMPMTRARSEVFGNAESQGRTVGNNPSNSPNGVLFPGPLSEPALNERPNLLSSQEAMLGVCALRRW